MEKNKSHLMRMACQVRDAREVGSDQALRICIQAEREGETGASPEARAFMAVINQWSNRRATQAAALEAAKIARAQRINAAWDAVKCPVQVEEEKREETARIADADLIYKSH